MPDRVLCSLAAGHVSSVHLEGLEPIKLKADADALQRSYPTLVREVQAAGFDVAEAVYINNVDTLSADGGHAPEWVLTAALSHLRTLLAQRRARDHESHRPYFMLVAPTLEHSPFSPGLCANVSLGLWTPAGWWRPASVEQIQLRRRALVARLGLRCDGQTMAVASEDTAEERRRPGQARRQAAAPAASLLAAAREVFEWAAFALWADAGLAQLLHTIEAHGALPNTLVITTADHSAVRARPAPPPAECPGRTERQPVNPGATLPAPCHCSARAPPARPRKPTERGDAHRMLRACAVPQGQRARWQCGSAGDAMAQTHPAASRAAP